MADNLQRLRCFAMAAELENFSLASQALHTAQSALSRQIAHLETELGVRLFDRVGRGVRLSAAGHRLKAFVVETLDAHDRLKAAARAEAGAHSASSICIAGSPSQAALLFPRLAARAAREVPNLRLNFIESFALESASLLRNGTADLVIVGLDRLGDDIALTPLFREQMFVLGAPPLPREIAGGCVLEQALALPLILPHHPAPERNYFERCAQRYGLTLHTTHEVDQPFLANALARDRQGYLLVPQSVVASGMGQDRLAHAPITDMFLDVYLGRLAASAPSECLTLIERLLREEVATAAGT